MTDQEERLRELNGVLDMAVLIAVDVICEHDAHGLSKPEWQRRLIGDAAKRLTDAGRFSGRLALFDDQEMRLLYDAAREPGVEGALDWLLGEAEFELGRRGILHDAPSASLSTVVPDGETADERAGG